MSDREEALTELVRLSELLGMYDIDPPVCDVEGCGRVCCRHHEAAS